MRTILLSSLFIALFSSCSVSQTKPFAEPTITSVQALEASVENGRFQSKSGGFAISRPQMPLQTLDRGTEQARATAIDSGKQYMWRFEKTLYTVYYTPPVDLDGNPSPNVFEDMVTGSKKGLLRVKAKITSEKPFTSGEFHGTELRYVSAEGVNFIQRLFIAKDFGYQVMGGYLEGQEKEVIEVLDSFSLIDGKR